MITLQYVLSTLKVVNCFTMLKQYRGLPYRIQKSYIAEGFIRSNVQHLPSSFS